MGEKNQKRLGTNGENSHGRNQKSKDPIKSCRKYCSKQSNL